MTPLNPNASRSKSVSSCRLKPPPTCSSGCPKSVAPRMIAYVGITPATSAANAPVNGMTCHQNAGLSRTREYLAYALCWSKPFSEAPYGDAQARPLGHLLERVRRRRHERRATGHPGHEVIDALIDDERPGAPEVVHGVASGIHHGGGRMVHHQAAFSPTVMRVSRSSARLLVEPRQSS
jgi:hypothetical protein